MLHFVLTEKGWLSNFGFDGQPIFQDDQEIIFYNRTRLQAESAQELLVDLGFTSPTFIIDERFKDSRRFAKVAWQSQSQDRDERPN